MQQFRNELYLTRLMTRYETLENIIISEQSDLESQNAKATDIREWQSIAHKISEAPNTSLKCTQIILSFAAKYAEMHPANNNLAENSVLSAINYLNYNLSTPK